MIGAVVPQAHSDGRRVFPTEYLSFLREAGLVGTHETPEATPLTGGISSDIWVVDAARGRLVIKHPLAELTVGNWHAPLERSQYEAHWFRTVNALVPGACPTVLASDERANLIAMQYLDPAAHTLWKTELLAGRVNVALAAAVGDRLGLIHERTAADPALAAQFDTEDLFVALRMHPYFETLAQRHPELSSTIAQIVTTTLTTRLALVHGDVSPKNILTGADGPILLDAECAWWGDPAFDLAFCLNHLLLKFLVLPQHHEELSTAFGALLVAYQQHTAWESPAALLDRTATLLPALLLARVDGRSPVEYLDVTQRATVRDFALPRVAASLTVHRETDPMDILAAWKDHLS
ncbi:MAG: hypothetical protein B5766_01865 [Candidatus Lumbricidophila eiseniae]|uniref:Aminoglycoside phosphotransferase domain-containing protein n=1 Tax=Candidatus Lumbricidiphila eiseniae TaxID=1969409 RepID=A0A2A6FUA9_9MICO|nr:MAG: hypothetical protein B5766_01865 [Candidatus Lumbricidophila eiseniae]